ncbi:MAG: hypothetical protein AB7O24_15625 [Kofleriaceae bacterium]
MVGKLDGNRSRIYSHADHRDVEMVFEANATDTALENISTKQRSRHGEGADPGNRFGGYGVAFNLESQDNDAVAVVKGYIDYEMNGTWTLIGTWNTTAAKPGRMNDLDAKYAWIRANSGDAVLDDHIVARQPGALSATASPRSPTS